LRLNPVEDAQLGCVIPYTFLGLKCTEWSFLGRTMYMRLSHTKNSTWAGLGALETDLAATAKG